MHPGACNFIHMHMPSHLLMGINVGKSVYLCVLDIYRVSQHRYTHKAMCYLLIYGDVEILRSVCKSTGRLPLFNIGSVGWVTYPKCVPNDSH